MAKTRLTPLAKGMIALLIIGALVCAGALLIPGGLMAGLLGGGGDGGDGTQQPVPGGKPMPLTAASGALGSPGNPLKVSIVSFHGYAPALLANGKSLTTQPGSIYANEGVNVEFVIQDNVPTLTEIFESGAAQCAWRTSDFWAQEHPNLRNAGLDAKAVMIVDNTQGGDAIISTKPDVKRIEDLAGKSVALLEFTPSHGMLIDAVENSSLSAKKKQSVKVVPINVDEGTAGVRAALESGKVDAAALWDPDLALAMRTPGAHVVYSTKTATNLIYDVIVCNSKALDDPANEKTFQGFVAGWMKGVDAAEANRDDAVDALVKTEEMFAELAKGEGRPFIKGLTSNLDWTGLSDNARILGLAGGTNHYERLYKRFDQIYRGIGALANPNSPVISPATSFDYRFIEKMLEADGNAKTEAEKPLFTFTETERDKVHANPAAVTKPIEINFATGSAELTKRAEKTIDEDMVPMIENNGSAYFEISGNTDSTGSRGTNVALSQKRANAVQEYLVKQWEFPTSRFKVVGNGPDKPLCDEKNPGSEGLDLEQCRAANRTVRLAVLNR